VRLHRRFVEGVDPGRVGHAAMRGDPARNGADGFESTTAQVNLGAFASERLGHRAARAVDHGDFVFE
jgi:hypothetical protein